MSWEKPRYPRLIQLRVDDELYVNLTDRATRDKTTLSEFMRSACREKLRKKN